MVLCHYIGLFLLLILATRSNFVRWDFSPACPGVHWHRLGVGFCRNGHYYDCCHGQPVVLNCAAKDCSPPCIRSLLPEDQTCGIPTASCEAIFKPVDTEKIAQVTFSESHPGSLEHIFETNKPCGLTVDTEEFKQFPEFCSADILKREELTEMVENRDLFESHSSASHRASILLLGFLIFDLVLCLAML